MKFCWAFRKEEVRPSPGLFECHDAKMSSLEIFIVGYQPLVSPSLSLPSSLQQRRRRGTVKRDEKLIMVSCSCRIPSDVLLQLQSSSTAASFSKSLTSPQKKPQLLSITKSSSVHTCCHISSDWSSSGSLQAIQKSVPVAALVAILLWSSPAHAGFLSGYSGIESVPGPQMPEIEFLNKFNEENQKKYADYDARFKESPLLKKLLEQSKLNKEKNRQAVLDKYCIRGAEWGVGDCSAEGMTPDEKDKFIASLKEKAGIIDE